VPAAKILPVADPHVPLHLRRFPYRAAGPHEQDEVNAAITNVLRDCERMIVGVALAAGCRDGVKEQAAAHVYEHLALVSLPRYDAQRPGRPTKVSTFVHECVTREVGRFLFRRSRERRLLRERDARRRSLETVATPDQHLDRRIERVARDVIARPVAYGLHPRQVRVLRVLIENPASQLQEVARLLGYHHPQQLTAIVHRIRARLAAIDLDEWTPPPDSPTPGAKRVRRRQ
jgi:hypothetical protein